MAVFGPYESEPNALKVPIALASLGAGEMEYVKDGVESSWISSKYINILEQKFFEYLGSFRKNAQIKFACAEDPFGGS